MAEQHTIQELMVAALQKMRDLVDSNTIIGSPITTQDGTTILPVSKISFGFISGGTDFATEKQKDSFGGAASSGASIVPVGFLVIKDGTVKLIQLAEGGSTADRVLNMVPEVMDKVEGFISKKGKKDVTDNNTTVTQTIVTE
ncbi:MAG: spore germination protein GerW family protein [Oscillospiraceae bacterium]